MERTFKHLDTYKQAKELAAVELKELIQNKEIPLKERFGLFMNYGEGLARHDVFYWDPESLRAKFSSRLSDDFFSEQERHRTIKTSQWIEYLDGRKGEKIKLETRNYADRSKDKIEFIELTEEDIDGAIEDILREFIWSFEYDW